ncbi:MAG: hypothetical protein ACFBZ9_01425 [Sphingomonadales bacterium]
MNKFAIALILVCISTPALADEVFTAERCQDIKTGIIEMLATADESWEIIRKSPERSQEPYEQVYFWSAQAANYSEVYDTFCEDVEEAETAQ